MKSGWKAFEWNEYGVENNFHMFRTQMKVQPNNNKTKKIIIMGPMSIFFIPIEELKLE